MLLGGSLSSGGGVPALPLSPGVGHLCLLNPRTSSISILLNGCGKRAKRTHAVLRKVAAGISLKAQLRCHGKFACGRRGGGDRG